MVQCRELCISVWVALQRSFRHMRIGVCVCPYMPFYGCIDTIWFTTIAVRTFWSSQLHKIVKSYSRAKVKARFRLTLC